MLTLAILSALLAWNYPNLLHTYSGELRITKKSKLSIEGSSNINEFTCRCLTNFPPIPFEMHSDDQFRRVRSFNNTRISIPIAHLDCGNERMNHDLRKALNADQFPNIDIRLIQAVENDCVSWQRKSTWVQLKALVEIELNGCSNTHWLTVMALRQDENAYRFISSKMLKMTDFGVQPPTALMGIVKVNNEIKISLDLEVEVTDVF